MRISHGEISLETVRGIIHGRYRAPFSIIYRRQEQRASLSISRLGNASAPRARY